MIAKIGFLQKNKVAKYIVIIIFDSSNVKIIITLPTKIIIIYMKSFII